MKLSLVTSIIVKEFKSTNAKKLMVMSALLFVMLFVSSIGQLGLLEKSLGLEVDGLPQLIQKLNEQEFFRVKFTEILVLVGLFIPAVVFLFYIGLPYMLSYYKRERMTKNLVSLLTTPLRPNDIVLGISTFAYIKILAVTFMNFFFIFMFYAMLGFKVLFEARLFLAVASINIIAVTALYAVNAFIWVTNGNEAILNALRFIIFAGLVAAFPAMTKFQLSLSFINLQVFLASIGIALVILATGLILISKFNKEKLITSLVSN